MIPRRRSLRLAVLGLCMVLGGCATVRTLTEYQPGDPVYMSGTRLNLAAINKNEQALRKTRATPPAWPWLDLPFSFVADLFFWVLHIGASRPDAPGSK